MSNIIDVNLREYLNEYFKPILDIKYVIGDDIDKNPVKDLSKIKYTKDLSQLENLIQLYYINESRIMCGQSPYLIINIDEDGQKYAEIAREFIMLANIADSLNVKKERSKIILINDNKKNKAEAMSVGDDNSFEDTIDERLDREIFERVEEYYGVKEMSSEKNTPGKSYAMVFLPTNNALVGKKIVSNKKGLLYDNNNAEPVVKTKEFKLFSN